MPAPSVPSDHTNSQARVGHPADIMTRVFDLPDEAATVAFGQRFARALGILRDPSYERQAGATQAAAHTPLQGALQPFKGLQVHLSGDLGAGKTTLVRATLHALGHPGRVRSPTYTLVEPYTIDSIASPQSSLLVYHFDLYRFADPAEWADAGFRDYFGSGALCLVEWPEQAGGLLGVPDLNFAIALSDEGRQLTAQAFTETGKQCLANC